MIIYNARRDYLVAFLIITHDTEKANKLWCNYNNYNKRCIREELSKDSYFKDYNFDFENFSYTLKKHN